MGCTTAEPIAAVQIKEVKQPIPEALLTCGAEPAKPASDAISIAIWIEEHVLWGRKCAAHLKTVQGLVDGSQPQ